MAYFLWLIALGLRWIHSAVRYSKKKDAVYITLLGKYPTGRQEILSPASLCLLLTVKHSEKVPAKAPLDVLDSEEARDRQPITTPPATAEIQAYE
jgi:hypothetical protein